MVDRLGRCIQSCKSKVAWRENPKFRTRRCGASINMADGQIVTTEKVNFGI